MTSPVSTSRTLQDTTRGPKRPREKLPKTTELPRETEPRYRLGKITRPRRGKRTVMEGMVMEGILKKGDGDGGDGEEGDGEEEVGDGGDGEEGGW